TARTGPAPGRGPARGRPGLRAAVPGRPGRRDRRRRGVLPAAGRARGIRPAAGPGGHHPGPARHVEARRHSRGRAGRRGGLARPREAPVTPTPREPKGRGPVWTDERRRSEEGRRGLKAARRRARPEIMVPDAEFTSYYGRPVIKEPVWQAPDVAGYLF